MTQPYFVAIPFLFREIPKTSNNNKTALSSPYNINQIYLTDPIHSPVDEIIEEWHSVQFVLLLDKDVKVILFSRELRLIKRIWFVDLADELLSICLILNPLALLDQDRSCEVPRVLNEVIHCLQGIQDAFTFVRLRIAREMISYILEFLHSFFLFEF